MTAQIILFKQKLPSKPHCADMFQNMRARQLSAAIKYPHIQPNNYNSKLWLVYDIDRPTCVSELTDDLNLPTPSIFCQNPKNHHAHAFYSLETPVHLNANSSNKAIRYAAAIDCALSSAMDADAQYCGLIAKNPLHERWRTHAMVADSYTLEGLSDWLDLSSYGDRRKSLPAVGLGRNVNLFNRLRKWAYKAIRQGWPDIDQWNRACFDRAIAYNQTENPLPISEVKSTAWSVAKWTHRHMSLEAFKALQAQRGARTGQAKRDLHLQAVLDLREQGESQRAIAEKLELPKSTVDRWLKRAIIKHAI